MKINSPKLQKNKSKVRLKLFSILTFISLNSAAYADVLKSEEKRFDLLLAGGGLKTCSSMAPKNCTKKSFSENEKIQITYRLGKKNIQKFVETKAFQSISQSEKDALYSLLMNIYADQGEREMSRSQLRSAFKSADALSVYQELSDPLYYALLDSLEVLQTDNAGQRKKERVSLAYNKAKASVAIYEAFTRQATLRMPKEQDKPQIVVVTASSRDPFEVADFYQSVFENTGAKVVWLPIDKTLQDALELEAMGFAGCEKLSEIRANNNSFYREAIYPARTEFQKSICDDPQLAVDIIDNSQGIFFNGGDQSLTLAALKNADGTDNLFMAAIRAQHAKGAMIVGGYQCRNSSSGRWRV